MDAKKLMIGNFVSRTNKLTKEKIEIELTASCILDISANGEMSSFIYEPISLTEEWMIKFGFIHSGFSYELKTEKFEMSFLYYDGYHFNFNNKYSEYSTITFYDVHEFQNLYLTLTGEQLSLK